MFFHRGLIEEYVQEEARLKSAVTSCEVPFAYNIEELDEDQLDLIAYKTNAASFHVSGNCTVLSRALLYNLARGKTELSIRNTHPFFRSTSSFSVDKFIFGRNLENLYFSNYDVTAFDRLSNRILTCFRDSGQRNYAFGISYKSFYLPIGHALNLVVLGPKEKPRLIFVDPWRSSGRIFTFDKFKTRYKNIVELQVDHHPWSINEFKKQSEKRSSMQILDHFSF